MTIDSHLAEELMDSQEAQRIFKRAYVLGFCFMWGGSEVVLIRKNKPAWQKGLLNGVGGKIESNETPSQAMAREWVEETGAPSPAWNHFVTMDFSGAVVHVFKCVLTGFLEVKSTTDEAVFMFPVSAVPGSSIIIPNLRWLIPMALYDSQTDQPHWKGAPTLKYP